MSDYVDADALIRNLNDLYTIGKIEKATLQKCVTQVRYLSVHGEWIKDGGGFDNRDNFYHCSKCGRTINLICGDTLENYPFCHCGADMRGGIK